MVDTALHCRPVICSLGLLLACIYFCLWWTDPERQARKRRDRLHRLTREIHPPFNRGERRALASKRWPRVER